MNNRKIKLALHAVSNPSVTQNLVSVHDLARTAGMVAFAPQNAYIVNTKQPSVNPIVGTAAFKGGLYSLDRPSKTAQARSIRTLGDHRPL